MHRGKKYQVLSLTQPPSVNGVGSYNTMTSKLIVYAKITKLSYLTRALQTQIITIVKRFESVEVATQHFFNELDEEMPEDDQALSESKSFHEGSSSSSSSNVVSKKYEEEISFDLDGPIAGNGVVTVK